MIKIGQIGIGHNHGRDKMRTVRKFPELFDVIGYAEENEKWIEKRGGMDAYQDLPRLTVDEVIARSDAVVVECDVWDLNKYAKVCIDAGKPIHLDKPYGGTLEEYRSLLDSAKAKGLPLQLGYMYRYNPAVRKCFDMVRSGSLGEIHSINAEMSTIHSSSFRSWLNNFQGGIQYILGCHMADMIVSLLGEPEKITSFFKHTGKEGVEADDNCHSVFEYERAIARVSVCSTEINGWGRRQFVVAGELGTICIQPMENPCVLAYSDSAVIQKVCSDNKEIFDFGNYPNRENGRYDAMIRDFYGFVTGKTENPYTYEHEYQTQKAIDKMVGGVQMLGSKIE